MLNNKSFLITTRFVLLALMQVLVFKQTKFLWFHKPNGLYFISLLVSYKTEQNHFL